MRRVEVKKKEVAVPFYRRPSPDLGQRPSEAADGQSRPSARPGRPIEPAVGPAVHGLGCPWRLADAPAVRSGVRPIQPVRSNRRTANCRGFLRRPRPGPFMAWAVRGDWRTARPFAAHTTAAPPRRPVPGSHAAQPGRPKPHSDNVHMEIDFQCPRASF